MSKFLTVLLYVLAVCSVVSCGLTLVMGQGWEQALGFGIFGLLFSNAADYFHNRG